MATTVPEIRYVAANVRRLRLKAGLTQAGLAEKAGLSTVGLANVESGRVDIALSTMCELAKALNVKPAVLLKPATLAKPKLGRPKNSY